MYIESKKRSNKNDNLMVFNFDSIEKDFNPFINMLEKYVTQLHDDFCRDSWISIVNKIKTRCDSKYAHNDVVVSSTLFADEYAEFMRLACIIFSSQNPASLARKVPLICPICHNNETVIMTISNQTIKYFCTTCGFERIEPLNPNDKLETETSIGAGAIILNFQHESDELVYILTYQIPRYTSEEEARKLADEIRAQHNAKGLFATWFDEETLETKVILS